MTLRSAVHSMRLRTLPLSLSGIILGVGMAAVHGCFNAVTVLALVLTALSLQVLSNLSNELGDTLSGTDNAQRNGMHYSLQDGYMTIKDIKILIALAMVCCVVFGLWMIYSAFGTLSSKLALQFIALGAAAIWAATRYTLGAHPYGYHGFGDIAVFVFFGLATTVGGYFICTGGIDTKLVFLPGISIGCFSVGVLNVNNIRDMKTDVATRRTVAIMMGERMSKVYHTILVCGGWAAMYAYSTITFTSAWNFLYMLTIPLYIKHLSVVYSKSDSELDPAVPVLVLSTFAFSILAVAGMLIG